MTNTTILTNEELEELEALRKYCKGEEARKAKRDSEWETFLNEFNVEMAAHLNDPKRKRWYDLGNGHTLMIQAAGRGYEDDYLIEFYEDCKLLGREYSSAEVIKDKYDIDV